MRRLKKAFRGVNQRLNATAVIITLPISNMNDDYLTQNLSTWINKSNWWKWLIALINFAGAPIYLAVNPQDYTPFVQVLLSIFLFAMAFWIGQTKEIEKAIRGANRKWLPQAESVVYRLITLHSNVCRFTATSKTSCERTRGDLPELDNVEMKAVRIKIQSDCEATSERLTDIGFQLEDAIEDWRRFIEANCDGDECSRIFDAIEERQSKLDTEKAPVKTATEQKPTL